MHLGIFGLLLGVLYYSTFHWLISVDWPKEDYNYAYLLPAVLLYLLWERKELLKNTPSCSSWWGFLLFLPGALLFWVGELAGEFFTLYLSSWCVAVGLLWMHLGWRKLKILAFPLSMVLFMFPLPDFFNVKLTSGLKLISSQVGATLLHLYGMSAHREGNVIDLGFIQLQVIDACSGLRFFLPLIIMAILLAYFYRTGIWKGVFIVLSSIPLSLLMNSLRIALTGVLYEYWGPKVAEDFFHGFSGWLIFMISFAVLFGELWVLKAHSRKKDLAENPKTVALTNAEKERVEILDSRPAQSRSILKGPRFLAALGVLVLTLGVFQVVDFREKPPHRKPFSQFPSAVADWAATRQYLDKETVISLDLTDYVMMDFRNASGAPVNFYVAYYQSQRKGESIHSPETCLPAGGWLFHQTRKVNVAFSSGHSMTVNRVVMDKDGRQMLAYFWFPARGRILTDAYEMKIFMFWDSLTRQRTDGSLVRIISPVLNGDSIETVEARMQDLMRVLQPIIGDFIPN